eukprot:Mrub_13749.p1 GENE.Mrub_13749~~Mrub_13749.p1  ORF type:complete len:111 (+),score=9.54 Mrub_13749:22-333(+)
MRKYYQRLHWSNYESKVANGRKMGLENWFKQHYSANIVRRNGQASLFFLGMWFVSEYTEGFEFIAGGDRWANSPDHTQGLDTLTFEDGVEFFYDQMKFEDPTI